MFVHIETFFFDTFGHPKAKHLIQHLEQDKSHARSPSRNNQRGKHLCAQKPKATSIESTSIHGEQTYQYRTQCSTNTMYGRSTDRIVYFKLMVYEVYGIYHYGSAHQTDNYRT